MDKNIAWQKIVGNEFLKRAIEISLTGNHKITVIGNPDNGKEYLEIILGDLLTFIPLCKCNNYNDPFKVCTCTAKEIMTHKKSKKYQKALLNPIICFLHSPTAKNYYEPQEEFQCVLDRINIKLSTSINFIFEPSGIDILNIAIQKFNFTLCQIERIKDVAKAIALLDYSEVVKTYHMSESIQYQLVN